LKEGISFMKRRFLLLPFTFLFLSGCALGSILPSTSTTSSTTITENSASDIGTFVYGEDYIANHLGNEYWIEYSYQTKRNGSLADAITLTSARNAEGYYFKSNDGTESLFIKEGTAYAVYMPNEQGVLEKVPEITMNEESVKGYTTSFLSYMTIYEVAKDDLTPDGEEVIAGRSCAKYVFHSSFLTSAIDLHYSIDKKTGVCLRYKSVVLSGKDTGAFEFLCTMFKDSNVTLPSHA